MSQPADPDNGGQEGTCPTGIGCPAEPIEFMAYSELGQVGPVKTGGMVTVGDDASEASDCDREVFEI